MTKVLIDGFTIDYQRQMAEIVGRIIKGKFIAGMQSGGRREPPLPQADLLSPPTVERLELDLYRGQVEDIIWIYTSDDFGIANLHLMFRDEQGNLIERGNATEWPDEPNRWGYLTTASVPSGTCVNIYVTAMDVLGSVGALSEWITVL